MDPRDSNAPRALVLAGGLGERLRPLTETTPKCLVRVGGRPLLDYWFDRFAHAGITEVRINTHHLPEQVRGYIREKNSSGPWRVTESFERRLLGSAGTVTANRDFADETEDCLIVYADGLSDVDLRELIQFHRRHGDAVTITLFRAKRPEECGIVELDGEARVRSFVEKPESPRSDLANAGLYMVSRDAYREMADAGGFDLAFDVLPAFIGRMRGWMWDGYYLDIGRPESLAQARQDVARWRHQGRPQNRRDRDHVARRGVSGP